MKEAYKHSREDFFQDDEKLANDVRNRLRRCLEVINAVEDSFTNWGENKLDSDMLDFDFAGHMEKFDEEFNEVESSIHQVEDSFRKYERGDISKEELKQNIVDVDKHVNHIDQALEYIFDSVVDNVLSEIEKNMTNENGSKENAYLLARWLLDAFLAIEKTLKFEDKETENELKEISEVLEDSSEKVAKHARYDKETLDQAIQRLDSALKRDFHEKIDEDLKGAHIELQKVLEDIE